MDAARYARGPVPGTQAVPHRRQRPDQHGVHRTGARAPATGRVVVTLAATAVAVFVLAVLLVTAAEAVIGHPLPTGAPGHTSLGDVFHPAA
jgi:hypothetical protein